MLSAAQNPFVLTGRENKHAELIIDNVLLRRVGEHSSPAQVSETASLRATRFTIENLPADWRGEVKFDNCLINGTPTPDANAKGADIEAILATFDPATRDEAGRRLSAK